MKTDSDPKGWRIAGLVVLLAVALTASAYYIHTQTFCNPAHPTCMKIGPAETHAAADASHAPAAGGTEHAPAATDHAHPADTGKKAPDHGKSPNF